MITFHTLKYKNFLSTGNEFTEIDFTKTRTTLVVGHNGSGKSTMLDALSFALFGRAHRNVNKPQLINSINNKDCVVEIQFTALGQQYKIVRGIKPAVFEIWQDDIMINQDSHAKEYQKILEQNILKLNHKSFHQIVVLGSSSFVPFMQLPAQHRRDVIEDLLDINVFSKMNIVLKEKVAILKDAIRENDYHLDMSSAKMDSQRSHIADLTKISDDAKVKIEAEIEILSTELVRLEKLTEEYTDSRLQEVESLLSVSRKKITELEKYGFQFQSKLKKFDKDVKFYEDNDTCPTCDQEITTDTKDRKITETSDARQEIEKASIALEGQIASVSQQIDEQNVLISEEGVLRQEHNSRLSDIKNKKERIATLQKDLQTGDGDSVMNARKTLKEMCVAREKHVNTKMDLAEQREYNAVVTEMLKDSGIKTKIIKQYLPVINKLTNQYLQVLDFYVSFDLDESFKETIKSRHRDAFSYDSFSEGEKQRIDLALLFTWRKVAKMKNSVATNLLMLDETFDSSLDADGVENLLKILDTLEQDTNVFIISHKGELLGDAFDRKMVFEKTKNFSKVA